MVIWLYTVDFLYVSSCPCYYVVIYFIVSHVLLNSPWLYGYTQLFSFAYNSMLLSYFVVNFLFPTCYNDRHHWFPHGYMVIQSYLATDFPMNIWLYKAIFHVILLRCCKVYLPPRVTMIDITGFPRGYMVIHSYFATDFPMNVWLCTDIFHVILLLCCIYFPHVLQ